MGDTAAVRLGAAAFAQYGRLIAHGKCRNGTSVRLALNLTRLALLNSGNGIVSLSDVPNLQVTSYEN